MRSSRVAGERQPPRARVERGADGAGARLAEVRTAAINATADAVSQGCLRLCCTCAAAAIAGCFVGGTLAARAVDHAASCPGANGGGTVVWRICARLLMAAVRQGGDRPVAGA